MKFWKAIIKWFHNGLWMGYFASLLHKPSRRIIFNIFLLPNLISLKPFSCMACIRFLETINVSDNNFVTISFYHIDKQICSCCWQIFEIFPLSIIKEESYASCYVDKGSCSKAVTNLIPRDRVLNTIHFVIYSLFLSFSHFSFLPLFVCSSLFLFIYPLIFSSK